MQLPPCPPAVQRAVTPKLLESLAMQSTADQVMPGGLHAALGLPFKMRPVCE